MKNVWIVKELQNTGFINDFSGDEQLWRLYRYIPRDDDFWINIVQGARLGDL